MDNLLKIENPAARIPTLFIACLATIWVSVSCSKIERQNRNSITVKVTAADTKGTVTTTDGLKSSGAFSMMAYLSDKYVKRVDINNPNSPLAKEDGTPVGKGEEPFKFGAEDGLYFTGNGNVTLSSSKWSIARDSGGNEYTWVAGVDTYFWAWHPVTISGSRRVINAPTPDTTTEFPEDPTDPDSPRSPYTGELTFSYTTPEVNGTTDADRAEDLLFAYSKKKFVEKKTLTDSDKTINITFHHALSQVRFCVSTDDGTFDKSLKIKSISISNLKNYGNASFTDSGNAENNEYAYNEEQGSYDQFVWTGQTGSAKFGQTYNADFSTSTVSGWAKGSYTKDSHTYNLYTCENVFFLIPQKVARAATDATSNMLTVVFDYHGTETTKSVPITGETSAVGAETEWLGDHYYTYKINATTVGRDIDLSVSLIGWSNRKEEIFI